MSKWDKLIARICALSKDMRFDELRKVLESYGYVIYQKIFDLMNCEKYWKVMDMK